MAHILSPHPPARFDKSCNKLKRIEWELVTENGDAINNYLIDLECLNREIIQTIDMILASDKSDPIIILQGDHGIRLNLDNYLDDNWNDDDKWILKHKILNSMKLPKQCKDDVYHGISSINTFRLIFNCIEDEKTDLLPDRIFKHDKSEGVRELKY